MKIGIVSDTHKSVSNMDKMTPYLKECDLILHAGDNIDDSFYIEALTDVAVIAVRGNCDYYDTSGKDEEIITIDNKRIFLCHGHNYSIKYDRSELLNVALAEDIDIIIFGHSHIPCYDELEGIIFINPGSSSLPRGGSTKGFGILDIEDDKVSYQRITI